MAGEKRSKTVNNKTVNKLSASLLLAAVGLLVLAVGSQPGKAFQSQLEPVASVQSSEEAKPAGNEKSSRTIARIALGAQTATVGVNVVVPLYYTQPKVKNCAPSRWRWNGSANTCSSCDINGALLLK